MMEEIKLQLKKGIKTSQQGVFVIDPSKRNCDKCGKKDFLTEVLVIQDDLPRSWKYHPLDGLRVCKDCLLNNNKK